MAETFGQFLRRGTPNARLALLALVGYVALSGVSVAWGLSGGNAPDNLLSARIQWDPTADFPAVSVTNHSGDEWTNVRVVIDGRYYHEAERVPKGQTLTASMGQFRDGYELPRPSGMYLYERTFQRARLPVPAVPAGYEPGRVEIWTDQGHVVEELE